MAETTTRCDFDCPGCGEPTPELREGYCPECLESRQYELDLHNARFDRWESLTDAERWAEIRSAI